MRTKLFQTHAGPTISRPKFHFSIQNKDSRKNQKALQIDRCLNFKLVMTLTISKKTCFVGLFLIKSIFKGAPVLSLVKPITPHSFNALQHVKCAPQLHVK